jgi:CheY-like chemotaxis protein
VGHCRCILLVEDDPGIRETVKDLLELEGFRVHTAENGREALRVLDENERPPCLILLDLMMPVMNGWEFLAVFHSRSCDVPRIPVAVISGASDVMDVHRFGHRLLRKPPNIDELLSLAEEHCGDLSGPGC